MNTSVPAPTECTVTLARQPLLARYPDLLGRGVMLGYAEEEIWALLFEVVSLIPAEYQNRDLDPVTSDAIHDLLFDYRELVLGQGGFAGVAVEAQFYSWEDHLVQVALDARLQLPPTLTHLRWVAETPYQLFCQAQATTGPY